AGRVQAMFFWIVELSHGIEFVVADTVPTTPSREIAPNSTGSDQRTHHCGPLFMDWQCACNVNAWQRAANAVAFIGIVLLRAGLWGFGLLLVSHMHRTARYLSSESRFRILRAWIWPPT